MSAVHVEKFKGGWTECGSKVGSSLNGDKSISSYDVSEMNAPKHDSVGYSL